VGQVSCTLRAVSAFQAHPKLRRSRYAKRALDFLRQSSPWHYVHAFKLPTAVAGFGLPITREIIREALTQLAPQVVKLQRAWAPAAILYSLTSQIWSDRAHVATVRAYEALNFTGLPVAFVSERQACDGGLKRFRAVVCPSVRHLPDDVYSALREYAQRDGHLWLIGEGAFGRDEYNRSREVALPAEAIQTWPEEAPPRQLRALILKSFKDVMISRHVVLHNDRGVEPWAVEYRAVPDGGDLLVSAVNYWGISQSVRILVDGRPVRKIVDLRRGQEWDGAQFELRPLQAMLLRVE